MEGGPSPFVPFLLVAVVTAAIWGPGIMNSASLLSEAEETTVSFVFVIPLIFLLAIYYVSESVIVPLILILVVYLVSRTLIGPLILVLLIHVLSKTLSNGGQGSPPALSGYQSCANNEGEGGFGWGSVWLLIFFLVVNKLFIGF